MLVETDTVADTAVVVDDTFALHAASCAEAAATTVAVGTDLISRRIAPCCGHNPHVDAIVSAAREILAAAIWLRGITDAVAADTKLAEILWFSSANLASAAAHLPAGHALHADIATVTAQRAITAAAGHDMTPGVPVGWVLTTRRPPHDVPGLETGPLRLVHRGGYRDLFAVAVYGASAEELPPGCILADEATAAGIAVSAAALLPSPLPSVVGADIIAAAIAASR